MSAHDILMGAAGNTNGTTYVEDVFSTYTYTGTSAAQTITNGIDLAGKGGLIWAKQRNALNNHALFDTIRGTNKFLYSNSIAAQVDSVVSYSDNTLTAFNANGFTLGNDPALQIVNTSPNTYVSWAFRKQPKFFDIVTYTGDGVFPRAIPHNLGSTPGMIIVKRLETTGDWWTYHRSLGATQWLKLNLTGAATTSTVFGTPTSSTFTVSAGATNVSGGSFVAYIFAHETDAASMIQCGSFTDTAGVAVNLGWEPQFILAKWSSTIGPWDIYDSARGMTANSSGNTKALYANVADAETTSTGDIEPTSTGFKAHGNSGGQTMIYMAIRRPNKPPTTGTQVFKTVVRDGNDTITSVTGVGFAPDLVIDTLRTSVPAYQGFVWDRLRGTDKTLFTSVTNGEVGGTGWQLGFEQDGIKLSGDAGGYGFNNAGVLTALHFFKRTPGFFDEVCYTGSGGNNTQITHNLGVIPELIIVRSRNSTGSWPTWHRAFTSTQYNLSLNSTTVPSAIGAFSFNGAAFSSTMFRVSESGAGLDTNFGSTTYVAYLFATLAGISKVGSYTGNGTSQTIACGFSAGARFVLIKRTDAGGGDWYVWDTARGIVTATDPHLSLNTSAAEVTTDDSIDPTSSGFIVNQVAATNINVSAATYIFLAIS